MTMGSTLENLPLALDKTHLEMLFFTSYHVLVNFFQGDSLLLGPCREEHTRWEALLLDPDPDRTRMLLARLFLLRITKDNDSKTKNAQSHTRRVHRQNPPGLQAWNLWYNFHKREGTLPSRQRRQQISTREQGSVEALSPVWTRLILHKEVPPR